MLKNGVRQIVDFIVRRRGVFAVTPEEKLAKIKAIYNSEHEEKDGVKCVTHAYYNMAGALIDIQRTGRCDAVSLATLKRVHAQLREIGRLLDE